MNRLLLATFCAVQVYRLEIRKKSLGQVRNIQIKRKSATMRLSTKFQLSFIAGYFTLFTILIVAAPVWGQTVSGSIAGTVLDTTQAAVPHARLTAFEQSKRTTVQVLSDGEGRFVFA